MYKGVDEGTLLGIFFKSSVEDHSVEPSLKAKGEVELFQHPLLLIFQAMDVLALVMRFLCGCSVVVQNVKPRCFRL